MSGRTRLAVRDPETRVALAAGASGELWIDAPSRFVGYLENPAATERAIGADGMFRTGDLGRLDGAGFIYEARLGDAMRLGGFLVSPEEIEAVIQALPGVAAVQVVAAACKGDPAARCFRATARRRGAAGKYIANAMSAAAGAFQGSGADCDCGPFSRR